VFLVKIFWFL